MMDQSSSVPSSSSSCSTCPVSSPSSCSTTSSPVAFASTTTTTTPTPSFALNVASQFHDDDNDNDDVVALELRIAETRAQLAALRNDGLRQRLEQAKQRQSLQYQFESSKATLAKSSNRLNMFAYTHAMLQAQTTVVQPYILKKQALLCHAFHHNEVLTKQIHLRQVHSDQLVAVLERSRDQIVDFWQPRLSQLRTSMVQRMEERHEYQMRIDAAAMILSTLYERLSPYQVYDYENDGDDEEEGEAENDYDDNETWSSASSSSSQSTTAQPSSPNHNQHHHHHQPQYQQHQDLLLHVLSMALTAVSEGRLPSVFENKKTVSASTPSSRPSSSSSFLYSTTKASTTSATSATTKSSKLDVIWEEKSPLRRSFVGIETI